MAENKRVDRVGALPFTRDENPSTVNYFYLEREGSTGTTCTSPSLALPSARNTAKSMFGEAGEFPFLSSFVQYECSSSSGSTSSFLSIPVPRKPSSLQPSSFDGSSSLPRGFPSHKEPVFRGLFLHEEGGEEEDEWEEGKDMLFRRTVSFEKKAHEPSSGRRSSERHSIIQSSRKGIAVRAAQSNDRCASYSPLPLPPSSFSLQGNTVTIESSKKFQDRHRHYPAHYYHHEDHTNTVFDTSPVMNGVPLPRPLSRTTHERGKVYPGSASSSSSRRHPVTECHPITGGTQVGERGARRPYRVVHDHPFTIHSPSLTVFSSSSSLSSSPSSSLQRRGFFSLGNKVNISPTVPPSNTRPHRRRTMIKTMACSRSMSSTCDSGAANNMNNNNTSISSAIPVVGPYAAHPTAIKSTSTRMIEKDRRAPLPIPPSSSSIACIHSSLDPYRILVDQEEEKKEEWRKRRSATLQENSLADEDSSRIPTGYRGCVGMTVPLKEERRGYNGWKEQEGRRIGRNTGRGIADSVPSRDEMKREENGTQSILRPPSTPYCSSFIHNVDPSLQRPSYSTIPPHICTSLHPPTRITTDANNSNHKAIRKSDDNEEEPGHGVRLSNFSRRSQPFSGKQEESTDKKKKKAKKSCSSGHVTRERMKLTEGRVGDAKKKKSKRKEKESEREGREAKGMAGRRTVSRTSRHDGDSHHQEMAAIPSSSFIASLRASHASSFFLPTKKVEGTIDLQSSSTRNVTDSSSSGHELGEGDPHLCLRYTNDNEHYHNNNNEGCGGSSPSGRSSLREANAFFRRGSHNLSSPDTGKERALEHSAVSKVSRKHTCRTCHRDVDNDPFSLHASASPTSASCSSPAVAAITNCQRRSSGLLHNTNSARTQRNAKRNGENDIPKKVKKEKKGSSSKKSSFMRADSALSGTTGGFSRTGSQSEKEMKAKGEANDMRGILSRGSAFIPADKTVSRRPRPVSAAAAASASTLPRGPEKKKEKETISRRKLGSGSLERKGSRSAHSSGGSCGRRATTTATISTSTSTATITGKYLALPPRRKTTENSTPIHTARKKSAGCGNSTVTSGGKGPAHRHHSSHKADSVKKRGRGMSSLSCRSDHSPVLHPKRGALPRDAVPGGRENTGGAFGSRLASSYDAYFSTPLAPSSLSNQSVRPSGRLHCYQNPLDLCRMGSTAAILHEKEAPLRIYYRGSGGSTDCHTAISGGGLRICGTSRRVKGSSSPSLTRPSFSSSLTSPRMFPRRSGVGGHANDIAEEKGILDNTEKQLMVERYGSRRGIAPGRVSQLENR